MSEPSIEAMAAMDTMRERAVVAERELAAERGKLVELRAAVLEYLKRPSLDGHADRQNMRKNLRLMVEGNAGPLPPVTDDGWCGDRCPHFNVSDAGTNRTSARCKMLDVALDYYDGFLAVCLTRGQAGPKCPRCGNAIDPDVCHCGELMKMHGTDCGHSPVPMGCECGRTDLIV